jgi:uncharacterized membrane protein
VVDVPTPNQLPIGLAPLAAYKTVVLANVSAIDLSEQRMKILQTYVRELGGGLVVIGGPNSYGVGGYYQTPLEEMLPVEMQIKDQKRIPRLTMIYVIDRSGSMEMIGSSGVTNLELAKEAARRSVNFLFEQDRAGVLSFDSNPEWAVPIQYVGARTPIIAQIGALRPGGGTDIYAAVKELARSVPADPSTLKHIILLTDGGADETGVVETIGKMHTDHGITVTSIGVGSGVPAFMRMAAVAGGGNYYNLTDLSTIPQIFAAETVLATRSYIVEEEFTPLLSANSQIMQGIDAVPPLRGYVASTAKPTATVVLTAQVGGFNDPLLASWQYGLGRVVAWTSDAAPRWSQNWVSWEGYQRFWSQVIRSTIVEGLDNALESRVETRNGKSILVVEARDKSGSLINGLTLDGMVVDPRLSGSEVKLRQVAPGRYEAELTPSVEGAYFIRLAGAQAGDSTVGVGQTSGWVLTYSPEYRLRDTNRTLLNEMATLTGGRSLSMDSETAEPNLVFRHDIREERAGTSLAPLLMLLAAFFLPLDIAARRLLITASDRQKLRAWARAKLGLRPAASAAPTASRISALKDAKSRAGGVISPSSSPNSSPNNAGGPIDLGQNLQDQVQWQGKAEPPAPSQKAAPSKADAPASAKSPSPTAAGGSLAARLAAEKRRQKKDDE